MENFQFELSIAVRDYELDSQGIVNNANYLHYLEMTRHDFCLQRGVSFAAMQREGFDPVVRRIEIEYLSSLTFGDTMLSRLRVVREGAKFVFHQFIAKPDGTPVVSAVVTVVVLRNGRLTRGDALAEALKGVL